MLLHRVWNEWPIVLCVLGLRLIHLTHTAHTSVFWEPIACSQLPWICTQQCSLWLFGMLFRVSLQEGIIKSGDVIRICQMIFGLNKTVIWQSPSWWLSRYLFFDLLSSYTCFSILTCLCQTLVSAGEQVNILNRNPVYVWVLLQPAALLPSVVRVYIKSMSRLKFLSLQNRHPPFIVFWSTIFLLTQVPQCVIVSQRLGSSPHTLIRGHLKFFWIKCNKE